MICAKEELGASNPEHYEHTPSIFSNKRMNEPGIPCMLAHRVSEA